MSKNPPASPNALGGSTVTRAGHSRRDHSGPDASGPPRVSWLKGIVPGLIIALTALAVVEVVALLAVIAGGFADLSLGTGLGLGAQLWLLSLGVPLEVSVAPVHGAAAVTGTVSLVPLGLSLLTAALSYFMGRRLARRAPGGAGLAGVVAATALTHALVATAVAALAASGSAHAAPWRALLLGGLLALVATAAGAVVGAGTPAALVGAQTVERARKAGQDMRWTGSYLWAVLRAACVAVAAAVVVGAISLVIALVFGWQQVVAIHQQLGSDPAGDTVFTLMHVALLPNFLVWALAWASGAGFFLGEGSLVSPAGTQVETVPLLPIFGALPPQDPSPLLAAAPALVVLCGVAAGWWFVREGENHLGEWLSIRIAWRVLSAPVVVVVSGVFIGAVTALFVAVLAGVSSGALGVGRLSLVGPAVWETALTVGAEIAIGAAIGTAVGPWIEQGRVVRTYDPAAAAPAPVAKEATPSTQVSGADADRAVPAASAESPVPGSEVPEGDAEPLRAPVGSTTSPAVSQRGSTPWDNADPESQPSARTVVVSAKGDGREAPAGNRESTKTKPSRGQRDRDREARRRESIEAKQRERALAADRKVQKRYEAAEKRRQRRKAVRDK